MKKVLKAVLVLAAIAALVLASSASVGGGCVGGKCDADAYADANVDVSISMNHTGGSLLPKADIDWVTVEVKVEADSVALASAIASIKNGFAIALTQAGTDLWAYTTVTGPDGSVIASDSYYGALSDWDFDLDTGKNALAAASAYSGPLSTTFSFTFLPTIVGEYEVYGYGDSIASADAASGAGFFFWLMKWCEDHGWDFAWDEAYLQFLVKEANFPNLKLEFRVTAGCDVQVTPYADFAAGRLGSRTFTKPAYLQPDPYVPGGLKYEPAVFELLGMVWYHVDLWCPVEAKSPLGAGTVASADFHVLGIHDGYQPIWAPFCNQAANRIAGLEVVNGLVCQ